MNMLFNLPMMECYLGKKLMGKYLAAFLEKVV